MGLRERARKSLGAESEAERRHEPVKVVREEAALDAEAKEREDQLRKELAEARKISAAKGAQIARQDVKLEELATRVKELEAARTGAERDAAQALKASRKRESEIESLASSLDGREKALAAAQDKLDAERRVLTEGSKEIKGIRAKLDARESELAEARKTLRTQADNRVADLEKDLEGARKDLAKTLRNVEIAKDALDAAKRDYRQKEIVLTTEMTKARGAVDQEREKAERLKGEVDELRKRLGRAGELSEKETELEEQRAKLDAQRKELADGRTALEGLESNLASREAEVKAASRTAVEKAQGAEKALKEVRERERTLAKLEHKIEEDRRKLDQQAKETQRAHAQEMGELRTLLQNRDRELAKQEKEIESHQAAARAAVDTFG
jgi:chromosome segregation ATPase